MYHAKKTRQDKTRQDKTRQDKTRQDKTRQDKTRQDKTRQDKTRQDKTRQDKTRQDRQDKTRQDKEKQGKAWQGILILLFEGSRYISKKKILKTPRMRICLIFNLAKVYDLCAQLCRCLTIHFEYGLILKHEVKFLAFLK